LFAGDNTPLQKTLMKRFKYKIQSPGMLNAIKTIRYPLFLFIYLKLYPTSRAFPGKNEKEAFI